jgi:hypothetical protein
MAKAAPGVTIDAEVFLHRLTALQPPRLDKAVTLALVDTAKNAISRAGSLIAKRTGLKAGTVKARIFYDPVRQGDRQVVIRSSRRPVPLIEFPSARQTNAGVRVNVWGRAQVVQSAFIATMPTGHRGIYRRAGARRLPIKQLWGPTIAGTFATPEVSKVISTVAKDRLRKNLLRRIAAEQRKRK